MKTERVALLMLAIVPLPVTTCYVLTLASLFRETSADAILSPIPTAADRRLLDEYEAADGALNFSDLVCLSGVVMLAVTFFERTGRVPTEADRASSVNMLQELEIEEYSAGAPSFLEQTLAHWVEKVCWRHPKNEKKLQQQLHEQTGFAEQESRNVARKLTELDWSKGTFQMAASELAGIRKVYLATTSFFQDATAKAPGCLFTATFQHLASGLEDAHENHELVRGGINRWKQFSIKRRILEWQESYEQGPQILYKKLMSMRLSEFETSIWLRELSKLQQRLQERTHEACEANFKLDHQDVAKAHGHPDLRTTLVLEPTDLLSDSVLDPLEVGLRTDGQGQPDFLPDFQLDPQDLKVA